MIHAHNVSKGFAGTPAVADLSFSVLEGEIFGIVGPDGAGKSTLLRMVSGILPPDTGRIEVGGVDVRTDPFRIKENLAYMPQRFGLYEDLTVEENIHFFGRVFGVSRREIREREKGLYDFSRLGPFRDRLAGKLSGGMKQKLGLACCLVHRPKLILLDEPTNGVDPVSRREFWKILYGLLAEGVTIVVSTAYLDEAERCNRVALMYEGRFVVTGRPDEIKAGIGRTLVEIRPSDVWKAEAALRESGEFGSIIREGNALRFFVDDAGRVDARIRKVFSRKGILAGTAERKVPSLENCFMEIISGGERR